jgi:predicted MFS family arabinose efflux permease
LSLIGLGLSAGAIGGAEVVGEFIAGWSVDRLGKRPVVITAGCLNVLLTLTIPLTGASLTAAQTAYFALFLFFEITVVGAIPLLTEIVPDARSVVMSLVIAAGALGRATGSWLGPDLFRRFGFGSNGIVAAVLAAIGIVSLALWVRESQRPISTPASIKRR